MLELLHISGGYTKETNIIHDINLHIKEKEITAIIGQNGAGKSTIAKAIIGFLPYFKGKVIFKNKDISFLETQKRIKCGIGYFMQGGQIFPNMTIKENLAFAGREMKKVFFRNKVAELQSYFEVLQKFSSERNLPAGHLSGGEKHQLALAMVLINSPAFLLLDEPSAGLSPGIADELYKTLNKLYKQFNLSILLIEQNVMLATKLSHKLVLMELGQIQEEFDTSINYLDKKIKSNYFKSK